MHFGPDVRFELFFLTGKRILTAEQKMLLFLSMQREGVPKFRCVLDFLFSRATGTTNSPTTRCYFFDIINKKLLEARKGEFGAYWKFADILGGTKISNTSVELRLRNEEPWVDSLSSKNFSPDYFHFRVRFTLHNGGDTRAFMRYTTDIEHHDGKARPPITMRDVSDGF